MAKAKLKAPVAPVAAEDILPAPAFQLSFEERAELRKIYESSVFKKAWHNAKRSEPGSFPEGDLRGPAAGGIALHRLLQQQGWKLFEMALIKQINDPAPARVPQAETFPDAGMEIVDPRKLPSPAGAPPAPLYTTPQPKKKR